MLAFAPLSGALSAMTTVLDQLTVVLHPVPDNRAARQQLGNARRVASVAPLYPCRANGTRMGGNKTRVGDRGQWRHALRQQPVTMVL